MPLNRAFETASVTLLLNKLVTQDVLDYLMKWNIDKSLLQKLKLEFLHINAVLNHAEEKQFSDPDVKDWLEEVKGLTYDAEDIVDEIATNILESRHSTNKVRNFVYDSVNASESVKEGIDFKMKDIAAAINPFKQRLESRMNGIVGRLETVVKQKDILNLKEDFGVKLSQIIGRTPTTPMFDESCVFGRESDKKEIMKLLESRPGTGDKDNLEYEELPCLRSLITTGCSKLNQLPIAIPSLQALEIDNCSELLSFPRLINPQRLELSDSNAELLWSMVGFISLTSLHIRRIELLKSLPEGIIKQLGNLVDLKIVACADLEGLSDEQLGLEHLASLQHLTISHCHKLVSFPDEEIKLPPNLKLLDLSHCAILKTLPYELPKVKYLQELTIDWCPKLESFPEQGLPSMLQRLVIRNCAALKTLPNTLLQNNTALEYLEIYKCSSLASLLEQCDLPTTLKHVKIYHCRNLASLPSGIMSRDKLNLEHLEIDSCLSLISFPAGELPTTLKSLEITDCSKLQSLPASLVNLVNLEHLNTSGCTTLECFPKGGLPTNLRSLKISECEKLKSLPERIDRHKFLRELEIAYCLSLECLPRQGLPKSLLFLTITDCEKLSRIQEWKLHKLTSLETLKIGGIPGLVSFPDEYPLPYSITNFSVTDMPDLESLSEGLKSLKSLESLLIKGCRKLHSLADKGILPSTLASLVIRQCPLLIPRCDQEKGDLWSKLESIPSIELTA
ncbi:disease resistance protein [Corchorus olitorius]|uniref:Disease resistance protein n=1 Tax=Corchorus olitorius TaxID=93759 RepID=A0A1R3JSR7_9ROSI|nr:disease resistance protein [Corchorus olitorius]